MNFAKPQFEKLEDTELAKVITEVAILLEALAAKEGVMVNTQLEWEAYVKADRNQFKQALVNIIKNAIEATGEGGEVSVIQRTIRNESYITITDTGKGMDSEQLARLGTLFYTTKDKGTGLGTSVSIKIIEAMGGKISYESQLNKGTEVTIVLPAQNIFQIKGIESLEVNTALLKNSP